MLSSNATYIDIDITYVERRLRGRYIWTVRGGSILGVVG